MQTLYAPMHRLAWTDMQYLLAVADSGSLAAAARKLGVEHSTVLRRVVAFEAQLGVRLFDRLPTGYALTAAGEEAADAARRMQDTFDAVERKLAGRDHALTGTLRVTTTDTLIASVLPKILAGFAAAHPQLQLDLTTTTAMLSLTKRDADVAIRPTSKPPEHLIGRRVSDVAFALYAAPSYLSRVHARRDLDRHTWLGLGDTLSDTSIARWMSRELASITPILRTDTLTALASAAIAGHGVAALPCYVGDTQRGLLRVRGIIPAMTTQLWILTHEDLRGAARIRTFVDWVAMALGEERPLIEGRRPLSPAR